MQMLGIGRVMVELAAERHAEFRKVQIFTNKNVSLLIILISKTSLVISQIYIATIWLNSSV
jgi:hypothetical protein